MIEFDNVRAASEGWVLADCEGSENGPYQLQQLDEYAPNCPKCGSVCDRTNTPGEFACPNEDCDGPGKIATVFESDEDVWLFVYTQAARGSAYHQAAIDFLKEHNPIEYQVIQKFLDELVTSALTTSAEEEKAERLKEAAPELLALVIDFVAQAEHRISGRSDNWDGSTIGQLKASVRDARALIAKINADETGESK